MANIYLKHKHSSTLYLLTDNKEYELRLTDGTITKRGRHTVLNTDKMLDKQNYKIICRRAFISQLTINNVQISQEIQNLLNVQLCIRLEYKLL